ncbi:uncharacterized protein LOC143038765 [Oratosquilla oratoria]|uniref:uncharacterized protein LOC143038765 n=1 Tax=Oratosquilla oratoria TaxID=337810 RepID=UPI003F76A225
MSLGTHGWFKRSKSSHPEFMYHRFPKEPQRCSKWIQVTGISTLRKKTPTQIKVKGYVAIIFLNGNMHHQPVCAPMHTQIKICLLNPAHPYEPEITSMDADIDQHLDTASTLQVLCITSKLKWKSCQVHWMRTLVSTDHLLALHNSIRPVNHKK